MDSKTETAESQLREKQRLYNRDYYSKNKDRLKLYAKIYNMLHKEKNLEYLREYYESITKKKGVIGLKLCLFHKALDINQLGKVALIRVKKLLDLKKSLK